MTRRVSWIMLFIFFFLPAGCGEKVKPGKVPVNRPSVTGVTAEKVEISSLDDVYETTGTVTAARESIISSRLMATITEIPVREGDRVKKDQLLITLDDRDVLLRVKAAEEGHREAELALRAAEEARGLAEATYRRHLRLFEEKALTGQELDEFAARKNLAGLEVERLRAGVSRAEAMLKEARVYVGFARIRAPFDGVITAKPVDEGSMASPGMPLLTLEDSSSFRVEAAVDERFIGKVTPGMKVRAEIDSLEGEYAGTVIEAVPSVNPASRSFRIKVSLDGSVLRSGLFARIGLPLGKREALLVPGASIVKKGSLEGVFAVDDESVITYRLVRTGKTLGGKTEILSGLTAGEKIVVSGIDRAVDGGILSGEKDSR